MAAFQDINKSNNWLRDHAVSKWEQTYKIKDETDKYLHPLTGLALLVRVEFHQMRAFYWFYSIHDADRFISYAHNSLKAECHEIIINTNRIKLFFDIDLHLTDIELEDLIDFYSEQSEETNLTITDVSRHLAHLFYNATLASLEEHGNDLNQLERECDMMYSTRNRNITSDTFKISIHLISNIVCTIDECKAIIDDIQKNILFHPDDYGLEIPEDHIIKISESIDTQPYHRHGSLAIPGGRKIVGDIEYINEIQHSFIWGGEENYITRIDSPIECIDFNGYNVKKTYAAGDAGTVSQEFVNQVLEHVNKIPYFDHSIWDLEASSLKNHSMIVRRLQPSYCPNCERTHDLDNTLLLIFNEEKGLGFWKCLHSRDIKGKLFYQEEDRELKAFASKVMPKYNTTDSDHIEEPQVYEEPKEEIMIDIPKKETIELDSEDVPKEESYEEYETNEEYDSDLSEISEIDDDNIPADDNLDSSSEESDNESSDCESVVSELDSHEILDEIILNEESSNITPLISKTEEELNDSENEIEEESYESDSEITFKKKDAPISIKSDIDTDGGFVYYHTNKLVI